MEIFIIKQDIIMGRNEHSEALFIAISVDLRVVLQSGYIFAEDLNVINKTHKWNCS